MRKLALGSERHQPPSLASLPLYSRAMKRLPRAQCPAAGGFAAGRLHTPNQDGRRSDEPSSQGGLGTIRQAAALLYSGFVWKHSPQGHEFWQNVVAQLNVVREIGEVSISGNAELNSTAPSASAEPK